MDKGWGLTLDSDSLGFFLNKQLEAKRGQQPVDANARARDSDVTKAQGLKRDLLQGDTPMSPSSVKQKGYWVELANGRQPANTSG